MTFGYGRLRVAVRSPDASHLAWLAEFLSPWFVVGDEPAADVTVTYTPLAAAEWAALRARTERADPVEVGCFVLDGRVVRHPAWREHDGGWTIADRELDTIYRLAPDGRAIDVLSGGTEQAGRVALMRVVRELAAGAAVRSGALPLHAAALARAGRAVLLAGPKRAGKTTLLLRALVSGEASFIANDRVVTWSGEDAVARGMPSIVAVRPEVLGALSPLRSGVEHTGYHHAVTMAEARSGRAWRRKDGAADLTPAQLCDLLGVAPQAEATVSAVVFPSAAEGSGRLCLSAVSSRDALPRLREAVFGDPTTLVSEVFGGGQPAVDRDPADLDARCRELLTRAPAFACRFDPARLEPGELASVVDAGLR